MDRIKRPCQRHTGNRRDWDENKNASTKILPFSRKISNCLTCGGHYVKRASYHQLCPVCWNYSRVRQIFIEAARLMKEVQK